MLGDPVNSDGQVIISLQPFRVETEIPVKTVGPATRYIPVTPAARPLALTPMETRFGTRITVYIDTDGSCHWPVFGRIIGQRRSDRTVLLENGNFLYPLSD